MKNLARVQRLGNPSRPATGGCQNGNLLVCGMHPYGWEGDSCPDWEDKFS